MKTNRRSQPAALAATVLLALLLLASCSGSRSGETPPAATTPAATTPAVTTPAATTPAATTPAATTPATPVFTVVFEDGAGNVLKTQPVPEGGSATPPAVPKRDGYVFVKWSEEYTAVTGNITVKAQYEKATVTADITVRVGETSGDGIIKNLLGTNNGPLTGWDIFGEGAEQVYIDATPEYRDMGITYVRLHDTESPFGRDGYVDIHCICPAVTKLSDYSVEQLRDPALYDFGKTDAYIDSIQEANPDAVVIYRLGESIGVSLSEELQINPYAVIPGSNNGDGDALNFRKWATVCAVIVGHYLERDGITYWEIWNEPDNSQKTMWVDAGTNQLGGMTRYCALYAETAELLSEEFGDRIKVGGPGLTYIGNLPVFLSGIKAANRQLQPKLDFVSFHLYDTDPAAVRRIIDTADATMKGQGLDAVELVFDEWGYIKGKNWEFSNILHSMEDAQAGSFYAASLILMEDSAVDIATCYDGGMSGMWGAFVYKPYFDLLMGGLQPDALSGLIADYNERGSEAISEFERNLLAQAGASPETATVKLPAYYAFLFYNRLRTLGTQLRLDRSAGVSSSVYSLAAGADGTCGVMLTHYGTGSRTLTVLPAGTGAYKTATVTVVSGGSASAPSTVSTSVTAFDGSAPVSVTLGAYAVAYIEFR